MTLRHRQALAAALAVLLAALAVALLRGRRPSAPAQPRGEAPAVELMPGQDNDLEAMLGRGVALPGGCRYTGADLGPRRVTAGYVCPGANPTHVLALHVGDRGQTFDAYAGRLGVVTSPGFPRALREALVERVGPRTQRLQWRVRDEAYPWHARVSGGAPPPPEPPPSPRRPPPRSTVPSQTAPPAPPVDAAPPPAPPTPPVVAAPTPSPPAPSPPRSAEPSAPVAPRPPEVAPEQQTFAPAEGPRPRPWTSQDTRHLFGRHDPTLGFLAAFLFIVAFTGRQLRRDPWQVAAALAVIVVFGVWVRARLALAAPMNAHPFTRLIPQTFELFRGPVLSWLGARFRWTLYFSDFQGWCNFALSSLMPLVFFTHARLLLGDARKALAAAALMAALPMHIRFAKSDVIFVLSLVNSSLTFATIYGALSDPSRAWRVACSVALPILSFATYLARPENYAFALLDLGALTLYLRADVPRRRVAFAAVAIAGAAGYAVVTDLLTHYRHNVDEGLSLSTLVHAWEIATDLDYNTLVNHAMTPPAVPALALVGGVTLWRGGERRKAVFLAAWLVTFFLVNSYVRAPTVTMQARYHLNLVSPVLLLAAAALPSARRLPELAQGALAAWLALSPWLHQGFIRDGDFTEMHEYAFLRRHRAHLAPGCTVLEFGPAVDVPAARYILGLRASRMSQINRDGIVGEATSLQIGALPPNADESSREVFALPADLVAAPPRCTLYYESAACWTHGPEGGGLAPACAAMHQRFRLALVGEARHAFRPLDDIIVVRRFVDPDGAQRFTHLVTDRRGIRLALYRVTPR